MGRGGTTSKGVEKAARTAEIVGTAAASTAKYIELKCSETARTNKSKQNEPG